MATQATTLDRPRVLDLRNGVKAPQLFSDAEMKRRLKGLRADMALAGVDAVLLTSYHNVCYFSGFLYTAFGRSYGLVVTGDAVTSVAANIDGGQPGRRSFGESIAYTDWQRDNFFVAVGQLTGAVGSLGIEADHISLLARDKLAAALPETTLSDISGAIMRRRMIKSDEEIALITAMAGVADLGGTIVAGAIEEGVPEFEVAQAATHSMVREISRLWPDAELMDTWTWIQSGINTDGAHNPLTTRRIRNGDILSLNCFPMVGGYYVALERTLFAGYVDDASRRIWDINCEVHDAGLEMLKPGARCCDIARGLNEIYDRHGLLEYRSFGYGHSFGVLCHYYGREAGLELREDVDTVLEPGMVVSMEPMVTIPQGEPGAGGYREHDIVVITEDGGRNVTGFAYGSANNVISLSGGG